MGGFGVHCPSPTHSLIAGSFVAVGKGVVSEAVNKVSHPTDAKQAHMWPQPSSMLTPSLPLLRPGRRPAGRMWGLWSRTGPHRSPRFFPSARLVLREDQEQNPTEPGAAGVSTALRQLQAAWKPHGLRASSLKGSRRAPSSPPQHPRRGQGASNGRSQTLSAVRAGDGSHPTWLRVARRAQHHHPGAGGHVCLACKLPPVGTTPWAQQGPRLWGSSPEGWLRTEHTQTCTGSSRHVHPCQAGGSRPTPLGRSYSRPAAALCTGRSRTRSQPQPTAPACGPLVQTSPGADLRSPRSAASGKLRRTPVQPEHSPGHASPSDTKHPSYTCHTGYICHPSYTCHTSHTGHTSYTCHISYANHTSYTCHTHLTLHLPRPPPQLHLPHPPPQPHQHNPPTPSNTDIGTGLVF